MAFNNPAVPWKEIERRLSDRPPTGRANDIWTGDGGDSPAWSRKRAAYEPPPEPLRKSSSTPYAELHCHSNFSFLDGASHPEELVEEATRLGLEALALTDHDGFYGVVRFSEAARAVGMPTIFGSELTLLSPPGDLADRPTRLPLALSSPPPEPSDPGTLWSARTSGTTVVSAGESGTTVVGVGGNGRGVKGSAGSPGGHRQGPADPPGQHLLVLARDPQGYASLARAISEGQLAGEKGAPRIAYERLVDLGGRGTGDHWVVLTACRKGPGAAGPGRARPGCRPAVSSIAWSGTSVATTSSSRSGTTVIPLDSVRNDGLVELAVAAGVDLVATANAHHHSVARHRLASALAAVRARRSLDEIDGWLPATGAHLRSGDEQARRFSRYPGVVERAASIGLECAFDLSLVAPDLPPYPCPDGLDEMGYLRLIWWMRTAPAATDPRHAERVVGAWEQLDHELDLIEKLGFPGYFLVVWDIVEFCRRVNDIFCQGRGVGGQLRGLLRPRHHQRRRGVARSAVRAVPVARTGRPARHRHRHRERPARGGDPVRLRAPRPPPHRPGRQRHHLPVQVGHTRHGQGPRVLDRPAGCLLQAGRPLARRQGRGRSTPMPTFPAAGPRAGGRGRALPPSSRHPFGRDGHLRPARRSRCARSSGAVWRIAASSSGTRTTAPRPDWSSSTCSGLGMLSMLHYAVDLDRRRATGVIDRPGCPSPGGRGVRDAADGPTPSESSRSSHGPRWRPCPGSSPATSTTWWSRSP